VNAVFDLLAEQRILEALRNGDFDHLPGAGRPLVFEDETFVSPEQRMANHILRNAGFAPPEIGLRREIARLRVKIAGLEEGSEPWSAQRWRLAEMIVQLQELGRG
jgi:hypothetical protein